MLIGVDDTWFCTLYPGELSMIEDDHGKPVIEFCHVNFLWLLSKGLQTIL